MFAPFLLIIIITSPRLLSGDVLLFYVSFSLLLLFLLLRHPERSRVTYCYSTFLFHYYYVTPNAVGWRIAILRFFFTIIIILIIIFPYIFVRSISRRCLDQTLWNLVGISYAMWSCAGKGWFFQNSCRCHGNGQNAKKLKNTKIIIAGFSPNRNWWNLIVSTSTASGTRLAKKNQNRLDKLCRSCHGNKKGGI